MAAKKAEQVEESKEEQKEETMQKQPKMVTIKLFKDNKDYKDDVFVGVNGKGYQIKRGMEIEVPEAVAEVLRNSAEQEKRAIDFAESMQKEYEKKTKDIEA